MNLNRFKWWLVAFLALVSLLGGGSPITAKAAQSDQPGSTNFASIPLLPKNQVSAKADYFDLKVQPGGTQVLKLAVENPTKSARTLKVIPVNATTADTGHAVYVPSNRTDPSAQTTFTDMTSGPVTLHLAAHQGKTVTFTTRIPAGGFTGQVLGGLFVTDPNASPSSSNSNFTLQNRYAEVTAVSLWCQPNQILPINLKLADVAVKTQNGQPKVLAKLRNLTPALFGNMQIQARILRTHTGKQVLTQSWKNGSMAPNSWFNLPVGLGKSRIAAGQYTLKLHITSDKRVWNFSRPFTLTSKASETHNALIHSDKTPNNWWIWLLLALLLVLLLIGLAYWLGKRRSRDEDTPESELNDTVTLTKPTDEAQSHSKS
ncbi:DUF916 and DUF3324 domain-containing protein [Levilactobacillus brevis]|nr:DUF916 and DUF3324 domain-containing protein [Levilactobacillus brevis]